METFASKVRHGRGPRFYQMLEEKRGWIVGKMSMPYEKMLEVVREGMAQGSKQASNGRLNPFQEQLVEILPQDRNYSRFVIRKNAILYKVDKEKLVNRIALLKD